MKWLRLQQVGDDLLVSQVFTDWETSPKVVEQELAELVMSCLTPEEREATTGAGGTVISTGAH